MEVGSSNLASPLQFQAFDTLDLSLLALETLVEVVPSPPPKVFPKALQPFLKNPKTKCFTGNFTGRIRPVNSSVTVPYYSASIFCPAIRAVYGLQTFFATVPCYSIG